MLNEEDQTMKIETLTAKLKTLILAAKLYKLYVRHAHTIKATRWSSVLEMFLCYSNIKQHLKDLYSEAVDDSMLTVAESRWFENGFQQQKKWSP